MNIFKELKARGLIAQTTNEEKIEKLLKEGKVTFYTGFDATADSLHVGHLLPIIVMMHLQKVGHRPIALLGTATTRIGDPTGKSDMRKVLHPNQIKHNANQFKEQISKFVDFSNNKAMVAENGDWTFPLNYIDFLFKIGRYFSVNKMLAAECFKTRLERGLSFVEFNYMLLQSYDFLILHQKENCMLQCGGDDQWSNILGGVRLIKQVEDKEVYGMTFTLLTTSEGKKMGKTEKGAIWLDPNKTSPYEFFQYWRNVDDKDVIKCLKMLTFIPLEQIKQYEHLEGSQLNPIKELLAFELTKLVHNQQEAEKCLNTAKTLFQGLLTDDMPFITLTNNDFTNGTIDICTLIAKTNFVKSKSEARRLIAQSGISLNNQLISNINLCLTKEEFQNNKTIIKKGKKNYCLVKVL